MSSNLIKLMNEVIEPDYCIGCGICASIEGSPLKMKFNEKGMYEPVIKKNDKSNINLMEICPFSNESKNETELGKELFTDTNINYNEYNGFYLESYAGYVKTNNYRERGASGGVASWIASKLLELDLVDAIIHVKDGNNKQKGSMYQYSISHSIEEVKKGAKSKYYPIELSQVIETIKNDEKTYAVIGIPCFIKSLRLLANKDPIIKTKIKYHIGLVCGHLKSSFFAESMAWEMGISPKELEYLDFRKKYEKMPSNIYGVEAFGKNKKVSTKRKNLYSADWGQGFFKYNACEFCDDVLSETADITIGDAWLPKYSTKIGGYNVIIVRNRSILNIINTYKHELELDELSPEEVYETQAGGFRHRREGLSYRLYLKDKNNEKRPVKRVKPSNNLSDVRKVIYDERINLKDKSFIAFDKAKENGTFKKFKKEMNPEIKKYNKIVKSSIIVQIQKKLKRIMREGLRGLF